MKKRQKTQQELDAIKQSWHLHEGQICWSRKAVNKNIDDPVGMSIAKSGHRSVLLWFNKKSISLQESNVVWFLMHDVWPEFEIDHIDGNPQNNALNNLRQATRSEQCRNRVAGKAGRANKGVYKRSYGNKWSAQIWFNGICKNLGTYDSEDEAIEVRQLATEMMHGSFANIKSYRTGVQA